MTAEPQSRIENPVPHIRYYSPYGGHPILRRKGTDAYKAVCEFLIECTDWDGTWPDNTVQGLTVGQFITADDRTIEAVSEFERALGRSQPGTTFSCFDPSSGTVQVEGTSESWSVPARLHDWAIGKVLAAPPARRGYPDPLSCTCGVDFRLREPPRGKVLDGQSEAGNPYQLQFIRSGVLLSVSSGNTSAFFDLVLPFVEPDEAFVQYVSRLRPYLPIRLAKGNFRRFIPNKARDGFVVRRVSASLFDRL